MFSGHLASIKKEAVIGFEGDAEGISVDVDCILETTVDIDVYMAVTPRARSRCFPTTGTVF